jgi:hypothetical protein
MRKPRIEIEADGVVSPLGLGEIANYTPDPYPGPLRTLLINEP